MLKATVIALAALSLSWTLAASEPPLDALRRAVVAQPRRCAPHEIAAGNVCMDAYEASVWRVPNATTMNAALVRRIQQGRATRADLITHGAMQLGIDGVDDYAPCAIDGHNCADDIFAVSLPSVPPSAFATWFQAQEACANAGRRLPTSAEWQLAASGTPDPIADDGLTTCNVRGDTGATTPTGERASCVSSRGAFDMVGNLAEWVADWVSAPQVCPGWASFSDDSMCLGGASTTQTAPGALVRGGAFAGVGGTGAGPFSIVTFPPFHAAVFIGFRCVR